MRPTEEMFDEAIEMQRSDNRLLQRLNDKVKERMKSAGINTDEIEVEDVVDDMLDEVERREKEPPSVDEGIGLGAGAGKRRGGLYEDEINKVMSKYKKFYGVYARDEIHLLKTLVRKGKPAGIIANTAPRRVSYGHWIAIYITPKTLEYFDSFGSKDIPKSIYEAIKPAVKKIVGDNLVQIKVNKIVQQRANNENCGYHAMKFLIDRFNGLPFKEITQYNDVLKSEKRLKKFIDNLSIDFEHRKI